MTWLPRNTTNLCREFDTVTTCAPAFVAFMTLITKYFGHFSNDEEMNSMEFTCSSPPTTKSNSQSQNEQEEYDFIIIGAGSAGCVVANRLSEIFNWKILLLEAGTEEPKVAEVPAFAPMLQRSTIDWFYMTQPQKHSCLSRPNRQCFWARGKVMGGSSTINYMMYVRGNRMDYDSWENQGNYGWRYEEVLPYFKKSEKNIDCDVVIDRPEYHGKYGFQLVSRFPYLDQNVHALVEAWNELGLSTVDVNAESQIGVMKLQMTQQDGVRVSTNSAYIKPIRRKRKNLTIKTKSHVLRILTNDNMEAYGVEYFENNCVKVALAQKEVILSAGSLNSPKILMLSGIGPKSYLSRIGIQTVSDLKVGENLQDHVTFDGFIFSLPPNASVMKPDVNEQIKDMLDYINTRKSPLTSMGSLSCGAFVKSKIEKQNEYPDIQYLFEGINIKDYLTNPGRVSEYSFAPLSYYDGIEIRPVLLAPRSRGFLRLNSSDPIWGAPELYPNYFLCRVDLDILVESIKIALKLLETKVLKNLGIRLLDVPLPNCKNYSFGSSNYWKCVIVQYTNTIHHPVGTCKMGPEYDSDAVVDSELRVYGVKNLRVIDASIMPKIVRGNTNAPTIMIGEKGSDLIKQCWNVQEYLYKK